MPRIRRVIGRKGKSRTIIIPDKVQSILFNNNIIKNITPKYDYMNELKRVFKTINCHSLEFIENQTDYLHPAGIALYNQCKREEWNGF